jgi:hypothetical protein
MTNGLPAVSQPILVADCGAAKAGDTLHRIRPAAFINHSAVPIKPPRRNLN